MAINVGGIEATLDAKILPFVRAMDTGKKKMDEVEKKAVSMVARVDKIGTSLAKIGGITAGVGAAVVGALVAMGKGTADYGSQIKDAAGQTKVGTDAIQELKFAAEQVGGSLPALTLALRGLGLSAAAASKGSKEQVEAYQRLGIQAVDASGKVRSSDAILLDLAESVRTAKDESLAMDDAFAIAGRSAFELRETFLLGRDGIKKYADEAHRLGLIMSGDQVAAADDYGDSLNTLKKTMGSLQQAIVSPLIPTFNKYINDTIIPGIVKVREFAATHEHLVRLLAVGGGSAIVTGGIALAVANIISLFAKLTPAGLIITGVIAGLTLLGANIKQFSDDAERNFKRAFDRAEKAGTLGTAAPSSTAQPGVPAVGGKTFAGSIGDVGAAVRGADAGLKSLTTSLHHIGEAAKPASAPLTKLGAEIAALKGKIESFGKIPAPTRPEPFFGSLGIGAADSGFIGPQPPQRDTVGVFFPRKRQEDRLRSPEKVDVPKQEDLVMPWEDALDAAIQFGDGAREVLGSVQSLASGLADGFVNLFTGAKTSFGDFFKSFMKQMASMIARAVILAALLSFLPGGGSLGGQLSKFFGKGLPADDPRTDQELRGEGGRVVDLFLEGMTSRMAASGAGRSDRVASADVGQGVGSFAPVIEINEASPMTWVRVTDRHIEPRLKERSKLRTDAT